MKTALETYQAQGIEIDLRVIGLGLSETAAKSFEGVGTFQNALTPDEFSTALQTATTAESATSSNSQSAFLFDTTGSISQGQTAEHTFTGNANAPLLITVAYSGDLRLNFALLDPKGNAIASIGGSGGPLELPFTPTENGEYTLRVQGDRSYGSYKIFLEAVQ